MDAPPGKILPEEFDVLISDIRPEDLATKVSLAMHCDYLSRSSATQLDLVRGHIYGPNIRSMFTLPVTCKGKTYNVHFLYNTGAPATFLASSALDAWSIPGWDTDNHTFLINGYRMRPSCFDEKIWNPDSKTWKESRFKVVNLLGMDFLWKAEAEFRVNAKHNKCTLNFKP